MNRQLRTLHRKIAPILFLPLFATALTGMVYRLGLSWFKMPGSAAEILMVIHQGRFLGAAIAPVYVLLMGLGLIGLIATGITLVRKRRAGTKAPKRDGRWLHRILAPIACIPLLISALTGIIYSLGEAWFNLPRPVLSLMLRLHQGSYLGNTLKPIYVLLVGLGLIVMLVSGIQMTSIWRQRRASS